MVYQRIPEKGNTLLIIAVQNKFIKNIKKKQQMFLFLKKKNKTVKFIKSNAVSSLKKKIKMGMTD